MAIPQSMSKLDMSLDEIIQMNRKQKQKEKQTSKSPPKARGGGGGKSKQKGAGGKPPTGGNDKSKIKLSVGNIRQKARRPQKSVTGAQGNKTGSRKPSGNAVKSNPRPSQLQKSSSQNSGIKSRLGTKGKGKQQVKQLFTSHGPIRGGRTKDSGKGPQRPGSRLKAIRDVKSARGNPANRGRGNAALKQLSAREEKQQPGNKRPQNNNADKRGGRGQGGRGINKDGKGSNKGGKDVGKGGRPNSQTSHNRRVSSSTTSTGGGKAAKDRSPSTDPRPAVTKPSEYSPKPLPSVPRPIPFDPPGVDLPIHICVDHHTTQPLHRRFTPQLKGQSAQRLVQKGGRTINYNS